MTADPLLMTAVFGFFLLIGWRLGELQDLYDVVKKE